MALAILVISCFSFYSTSKYFPEYGIRTGWNNKASLFIASALALLSLVLFNLSYDFATALIFWMLAFMAILSAVILSIKMNAKWVWIWGLFCILMILVDLI